MLRTHRQANRDDGFERLRQLWLVWLALVLAMFAANPAPRPFPPSLLLSCADNTQEPASDAKLHAHPTLETIPFGRRLNGAFAALAPCVWRRDQRSADAWFASTAAVRRKLFARQILPGALRMNAHQRTSARTTKHPTPV